MVIGSSLTINQGRKKMFEKILMTGLFIMTWILFYNTPGNEWYLYIGPVMATSGYGMLLVTWSYNK